jgi:hypothetical protein
MSVLVPFPPLRPETLRAIVVVGDHGETAVALRDQLPRAMAVVLDARPAEAAAAVAICRPHPWAVVWASAGEMPVALAAVRIPTIALARASCSAPLSVERWSTFTALLARLRQLLAAEVGGMRLAPGMGVEMPDGSITRSALLQALVSMHPAGVAAPAAQLRAAQALLSARCAGWTAARRGDGTVALVAEVAA